MAKTDNLTDFLTDIADAIREKKGTTDKINPQNFSDEIASIQSGSELPLSAILGTWAYVDAGGGVIQLTCNDDYSCNYSYIINNTPEFSFDGIFEIKDNIIVMTSTDETGSEQTASFTYAYIDGRDTLVDEYYTYIKQEIENDIPLSVITGKWKSEADGMIYQLVFKKNYTCTQSVFSNGETVYSFNGTFTIYKNTINTTPVDGGAAYTYNYAYVDGQELLTDINRNYTKQEVINGLQWKCDNMKSLAYEFSDYYTEDGSELERLFEGLDTSKVTSTVQMFGGSNDSAYNRAYKAIPYFDTSSVTNMSNMFNRCSAITTIPLFNTSNVDNMKQMFIYCRALTDVPQLDTSKVTVMEGMFSSCTGLTTIPLLNTSNVKNMINMFSSCTGLTTIPQLDTSNVEYMTGMFYSCTGLTTIPQLDTSNVKSLTTMFYKCSKLTEVPPLDIRKVTSTGSMFSECIMLTTIPYLDMSGVVLNSNTGSMFYNCKALTNLTLLNIKVNLQIGSGTSWGHLLTLDSLINTIKELWDYSSATSMKTLTMGSANLAKIAEVYVKLVDVTDEMLAADEYADQKLPCVVCDSTDEGAMTLTEYALEKNWTLA